MFDFNDNQACPIGLAAELIGDKWSIIILRDIAVLNRQTYSRLYNKSLEGISSATLAKRLKRLLDIGMLTVSNDKLHSQKKSTHLQKPLLNLSLLYLIWLTGVILITIQALNM